ncbi:MAG: 4'-phosphopantetheinyl transferase superfamily protein [Treponema sp.]|nr:4'-phosphopantetheinyl transferase superfamily protein [Treponema sp.]
MDLFYIGLSRLSTPGKTPGEKREALSSEARRILGVLDRDSPIAVEAGGRPYFADFHADFNISHSRDMAALAFSAAQSSPREQRLFRVGCDVQYMNPGKNHRTIAERFFSRAERDYIAAGRDEGNRRFYMIWTLKECWLKLRGLSVFDMGKAPVFYVGSAPRRPRPGPRARTAFGRQGGAGVSPSADFYLYELEGAGERYMLAAARERSYAPSPFPSAASAPRGESAAAPVLRWFSETTLRVSSIDEIYAEVSPEKTTMPKS